MQVGNGNCFGDASSDILSKLEYLVTKFAREPKVELEVQLKFSAVSRLSCILFLNSKGYPLVANIGHGSQSFIYVMLNVLLDHFRLS